jgi:succinate dehydrogenase/fumarate reductase flavoprotein subunit
MERTDVSTDVLVVGNGGAGLRAAVEAAEQDRRVVLASKIGRERPNSTAVIAGWGAYVRPEDAESYFRTVVSEGNYLSDQELAWQYASEVVERMPELQRFGVEMRLEECTLERPSTRRDMWFFPGPRGRLGDAIRDPLRVAAVEAGVSVLDSTVVTRLLTSEGRVVGATALDLESGELLAISSKAVIVATGGASGCYARQNNPAGTIGDGFALAYEVGGELVDMEFDTFMSSHEQLEALFAGRLGDEEALATAGAHYSCGGIRVDSKRHSTVLGLYAAGEAAGGTFGSARLGGSAVGDIIVSGYLAGRSAAEAVDEITEPELDDEQVRAEYTRLTTFLERAGTPAREVADQLRRVMWEKVGPLRRDATLREGLDQIHTLRGAAAHMSAETPRDVAHAVEVEFMLEVGEAIAATALERTESRGNHWRVDHPEPNNDEWLCNLVVRKGSSGGPHVTREPTALTRVAEVGPCRIGSAWTGGYVSAGC